MNKKGFTLIELLVVIVIIGILVAIALPNFIKIKDKAREAETKQNLHAIQLALERYSVDSPASDYPLYIMGGDWSDTFVVWQSWMDTQNMTTAMITNGSRFGLWQAAPQWLGDTLVMESYMPAYPGNPFVKSKSTTLVPELRHTYPQGSGGMLRAVGGLAGDKMVEIFGPVNGPIGDEQDQPFGDMCVHHIYNNPVYDDTQIEKTPPNGWTNPSGNRRLVGNFSYYPRQGEGGLGWMIMNAMTDTVGYTLAGYGALRTPGQDVHNRNGDFKGRYRACPASVNLTGYPGYEGIVPAIPLNDTRGPSVEMNNGGMDTLRDGVIITLDSGVDKKTGKPSDVTEGESGT
jgi:prepilin-type N-terminal cleavage/methylation domain-containing protein